MVNGGGEAAMITTAMIVGYLLTGLLVGCVCIRIDLRDNVQEMVQEYRRDYEIGDRALTASEANRLLRLAKEKTDAPIIAFVCSWAWPLIAVGFIGYRAWKLVTLTPLSLLWTPREARVLREIGKS